MKAEYATLFGRMCYFSDEPPLLFGIPEVPAEVHRRLADSQLPVEMVVPDLDAFCVPEEDVERIGWAVQAALALE